MAALLRHMFTAPQQQPWPFGSLRLINVGGLPVQALYSAERFQELNSSGRNRLHQPGDVWVVSYPKSGTTWTIGLLAALLDHPAASYCGSIQRTTRQFCPQPELPDLGWGEDGFGHSMATLNNWPQTKGKRCFKSHWPSRDFVARGDSSTSTKYIYVMRNAQDQMISHWNQVWGMGFHYGTENRTFDGGWYSFVEDWLAGNVEMGKWIDHVAGWYQRSKDDPNALVLRYEELKADTAASIRRIAQHIQVPLNDDDTKSQEERVDHIMNLTSFERMKETDESDAGLQFMRWLGVLRTSHIRQGETGTGGLQLSPQQLAILHREYDLKLAPLGVPRDWVFLN